MPLEPLGSLLRLLSSRRRKLTLSVAVHRAQKGNPIIDHIRTVPWEYGDIKCDYQVGATAGVLFLSCVLVLLGSSTSSFAGAL